MNGDFPRPTLHEPCQDLNGVRALIGTEQGLWLKRALRIANEHPTDRNGRNWRLIPQSRASRHFPLSADASIPGNGGCLPHGCWVGESRLPFGLGFPFQGRPTPLPCLSLSGRIRHAGIQTQAGNHDDLGQLVDGTQELQNGRGSVSHHHQGALRSPATELPDHLPGPIGDRCVRFLALFMGAFRWGQHGQKGQGPSPLGSGDWCQEHQ